MTTRRGICKRQPGLGARWSPRGFTLIELLIAVTVAAILAAIAIPSYSAYIVRGKRSDAKAALLQAAQQFERNFTQAGCYNFADAGSCSAGAGNPFTVTTVVPNGPTNNYAVAPSALAGQSFTLAATPCGSGGVGCAAGSNFTDAACGTFTLSNTGLQAILNGDGSMTSAQCWGR